MDDDRRLAVSGAKSIPFRITGSWDGWTWRGIVRADEVLAALLLVRDANGVGWSRSRRTGSEGLDLTVRVGSDPAAGETWCMLDLGGGLSWGRIARMLNYEFAKIEHSPRTGLAHWLPVCVGGDSALQIGLLALARTDVRFGRKRIWRLRPELRASLNDDLRRMLVERRFGSTPV